MKQITKYVFVVVALLVCFSCKKYPEDKKISLATAKQRINQTWKFNILIVNDVDSTDQVINCYGLNKPNDLTLVCTGFKFGRTESSFEIYSPNKYKYDNASFVLKQNRSYLVMEGSVGIFFSENYYSSHFIIRKLTNKDFVIEGVYKSKKYRYEFVR